MTILEFVNMQMTSAGISKTAAVNLAVAVTGISPRSAWMQITGDAKTPAPVARLLDVYVAADVSVKAKKGYFRKLFLDVPTKVWQNGLVKKMVFFLRVKKTF